MGRRNTPMVEPKVKSSLLEDGLHTDLVIPVMGPLGVGKSTFINKLYGRDVMKVSKGLRSCTEVPKHVIITPDNGPFNGYRLILVDTPPFNSTGIPDFTILERVSQWLEESYKRNMKIAGVVYLFDISQDPTEQVKMKDRNIFMGICGFNALTVVVVGVTTTGTASSTDTEQHKIILSDQWTDKYTMRNDSMLRFTKTPESAWSIINHLAKERINNISLQLQQELVVSKTPLAKTEAGKLVGRAMKEKPIFFATIRIYLRNMDALAASDLVLRYYVLHKLLPY